jgi:hypothetical protein
MSNRTHENPGNQGNSGAQKRTKFLCISAREYHTTKDLLHIMAFLGHKKSDNTLLCVQLDEKLFTDQEDQFTIKTAHDAEEAAKLGEIGFEPFDIIDGMHLYRKRK